MESLIGDCGGCISEADKGVDDGGTTSSVGVSVEDSDEDSIPIRREDLNDDELDTFMTKAESLRIIDAFLSITGWKSTSNNFNLSLFSSSINFIDRVS